MAYVPAPNAAVLPTRVEAVPAVHSCWLVEKIKELFRQIVVYFSPYTKVDLETRLNRLVKLYVKDYAGNKDHILTRLNFEASEMVKEARVDLNGFYDGLKNFQLALVHACALKHFRNMGNVPEEIRQINGPHERIEPLKDVIYKSLLERFSEDWAMQELFQAAVAEVRRGGGSPSDVSGSLKEKGVLPQREFNRFTTDLSKTVAREESTQHEQRQRGRAIGREVVARVQAMQARKKKKGKLEKNLGQIIGEQGTLFRLVQSLKECYPEKEELLREQPVELNDLDAQKYLELHGVLEKAEQINQDVKTLSEKVLFQKGIERGLRAGYLGDKQELTDAEKREIERLEHEMGIQGSCCDGVGETLTQLRQKGEELSQMEALLRKACRQKDLELIQPSTLSRVRRYSLEKVGQGYEYVAKHLQGLLGGVEAGSNGSGVVA